MSVGRKIKFSHSERNEQGISLKAFNPLQQSVFSWRELSYCLDILSKTLPEVIAIAL